MDDKYKKNFKIIGLNIAYYRKLKGLSQMQLAELVNVSRTHISNIEAPNMPTSISLEKLFDISEALDVPAAYLLSFRNEDVWLQKTFIKIKNKILYVLISSKLTINFIL